MLDTINMNTHMKIECKVDYLLNVVVLMRRGEKTGDAEKVMIKRQILQLTEFTVGCGQRDPQWQLEGVSKRDCGCLRASMKLLGQGFYHWSSRTVSFDQE